MNKIYARVAQRWSISLPRRGSRVRSPSRAYENKHSRKGVLVFLFGIPSFWLNRGVEKDIIKAYSINNQFICYLMYIIGGVKVSTTN